MSNPPCDRCKAECCQYVPMSLDEYNHLQMNVPRAAARIRVKFIDEKGNLILMGRCPWLRRRDWSCSAYPYRPSICRLIGMPMFPCHRQPQGPRNIKELAKKIKGL